MIFISFYFLILKKNFFISTIFAGLAFGTKAQGIYPFIFILLFFLINSIRSKNFSLRVLLSNFFSYITIFIITFYLTNRVQLIALINKINLYVFKHIHAVRSLYNTSSNFSITNIYLSEVYFQSVIILTIFILFIIYGIFKISKTNNYKKVLYFVSLTCLIIFYLQIINMNRAIQGPRYLVQFLPIILILICFNYFFIKKKFKSFIKIFVFGLVILFYSYKIIINFSDVLQNNNFVNLTKKDPIIVGGNSLKSSKFEINSDTFICASYYTYIPKLPTKLIKKEFSIYKYMNNNEKKWGDLNFDPKFKTYNYDLVLLDHLTVGRYIWFENIPNEYYIIKDEDLNPHYLIRPIEERIKLINTYKSFFSKNSDFSVKYFNEKMVILKNNK